MTPSKPHDSNTARPLALTWALLSILVGLGAACSQPVDAPPDGGSDTTAATANRGNAVASTTGKPLGTVDFPNSCDPAAQEHLERGLALLHHMTYLEAEGSFRTAAETDPECAIAYWGQAMTYVHPLWPDVVPPDKLAAGRGLLEQAAGAARTSEREQAYIAALAAYYEGDDTSEPERLAAFQAGWAAAHDANPDDSEAAVFHALSLLGTASPTDKTYVNQKAAGAITEAVLAEIPKHPGAHHYTIHAYDFPPLAENALATARSYDDVAPENSHALHMTSHIFTRRGLWPESIAFNRRAADAALERTPAGEVSMHRLHALDYLAYAYLQQADDAAATAVFEQMRGLEPPFQHHAGTAYSFAAVPARMALERHDWEQAAALETGWPTVIMWDKFPHLQAIPYFAQALGAAHTGDFAAAESAIARLEELEAGARQLPGAYDWGIQVEIQKLSAMAWLAWASGNRESALALMSEAAAKEASTEKNPVTPGEVLPARELYGDMLVETGDYAAALAEYRAALERSPNRFNSLYGAGRAAELAGDDQTASDYYRQLLEIAPAPTGQRTELEHARLWVG